MNRQVLISCAAIFLGTSTVLAAPVWESTFDSNADGIVDIKNQDSLKVMIGSNSGGVQTLLAADNGTDAYTPDKVGRPLGATLGGTDSFSARYVVSWSNLPQTSTQVANFAGFLGDAGPQTRQVAGGILQFWKIDSDYYVAPWVNFGTVGATDFAQKVGPSIWIGQSSTSAQYQLVMSYDGSTRSMNTAILDMGGTILGQISGTVAKGSMLGNLNTPANIDTEVNSLAVTHLGLEDYTYNGTDDIVHWDIDKMAYYNTAGGALAAAQAAVPEPASLGAAALAGLFLLRRRRAM